MRCGLETKPFREIHLWLFYDVSIEIT
jgi:hypothetical protein